MINSKTSKAQKTARIYYGPDGDPDLYYTVKVKPAKRPVKINGTLMDALTGDPGSTIGCHLSNCATRNQKNFPHPVFIAAFTKTTVLIVDKLKNGSPYSAIKYKHSYGDLVELNDMDKLKERIKNQPELAQRDFILTPYVRDTRSRPGQKPADRDPTKTGTKRASAPVGALKRAVDAGLIGSGLARVLKDRKAA